MIENQLSTLGYYQMAKSSLAVRNTGIQVPISSQSTQLICLCFATCSFNMCEHIPINSINFPPSICSFYPHAFQCYCISFFSLREKRTVRVSKRVKLHMIFISNPLIMGWLKITWFHGKLELKIRCCSLFSQM